MTYNFDEHIDRTRTNCAKWTWFGEGVLPMWVADMDFRSPPAIMEALHKRVETGVFGYGVCPDGLREVIVERLQRLYHWTVQPEELIFLPGVVSGIHVTCETVGQAGDGVLMTTPVYHPFLDVPLFHRRFVQTPELIRVENGQDINYEIDFDAFEATITGQTSVFVLCNPHNPIGRVFTRDELARMAEICLKHDVIICSDELHCDLLFDDHQHIPTASLSPEIAANTIALFGASKAFNIPGLKLGFAVIQNPDLYQRFEKWSHTVSGVNVLGYPAMQAAYEHGQAWLDDLLAYLQANRDHAVDYIKTHLPQIGTTTPEGTYLLWLDCRNAGIEGNPHEFFLEQAKVAVNDGGAFGRGGEGFVRLNFGCPRAQLTQSLDQMRMALEQG